MKAKKKILNLYGGVGGNCKLWPRDEYDITTIEYTQKIADVYSRLYPQDTVIVADAHEYLLNHANEYDFIWSSPPCQSHSRMIRSGRNRKPRYADLRLYEEILFLQNDYTGPWVVENVQPYYEPLIKGKLLGRHYFWSNFEFSDFDVKRPKGFINKTNLEGKKALMDWLGIHFEENLYYEGNHCPAQVLRNCVHPKLGLHIFNEMKKNIIANLTY